MGDQGVFEANESPEEMSAIALIDRLINEIKLTCKNCQQFLLPPIMIAKEGNICGNCYGNVSDGVIHNSVLEQLLQQFSLPCVYYENGCRNRSKYYDMASHMLECSYRNYNCPIKMPLKCKWSGFYKCFLEHFSQEHPACVERSLSDIITFTVEIDKDKEDVQLLSVPNGIFIVFTKCDIVIQKLQFSVFYVGNPDSSKNFYFVVQQKDTKEAFASHESDKIEVFPITDYMKECKFGLSLDLNLIKHFILGTQFEGTIRISSKEQTENKKLDETLLKYMECPVCSHYMRPPIYQCISGHSICHLCRPKMAQCPTCRSQFGSTRNYALEEFSSGIQYPCIYHEQGCIRTFTIHDIDKHESECCWKPYSCPFADDNPFPCRWSDVHSKISDHLKEHHLESTFITNCHKTTIPFTSERQFFELFCIIAYGEVFRVSHIRDIGNYSCHWSVQFVGPSEEAEKFRCEVGLIDEINRNRKLIREDICQKLTNFNNLFSHSIMLPTNVTKWFSSNGHISYYVKIIKANR